jgi:tetratricopeptide (TPR) repeat protein
MKRIILLFSALLVVVSTFGQTSKQVNFGAIQKKLDKSKLNIEHVKKGIDPKTWIQRAEVFVEAYEAMTLKAYAGIPIAQFNLIVGIPKEKKQNQVEEQMITEYIFDRTSFFFSNDVLEYWVFKDNLVEKPLFEAYACYEKAIQLDEKKKQVNKLKINLVSLKQSFITEGINEYTQKNYSNSFSNFAKAVEIGENSLVSAVDTTVVYYAGLTAQLAKDYENSLKFYKKALEYNYTSNGNIYYNIYEAYSNLGQAEVGLTFLQDGFVKFPKNQSILLGLINYYIIKGEDPKLVINYIHQAIEADPNEPSLHFAEGTLHDKLGNFTDAEKSYSKAIELNPKFFDALFNLGALYYNSGVKYLEEEAKVPVKEYQKSAALIEKSNAEFRKSIPYMEKAVEVTPTNKSALETLKNLYYRFRTDGEEMMNKYNKIVEIIKNLPE